MVEIDLDAETAETHRAMHGADSHARVVANVERLIAGRRLLGTETPLPAEVPPELRPGLPWIVPRIERRVESIGELPEFFERWRRRLGSAVVDGPIRWPKELRGDPDPLSETHPPRRADRLVATTRLTILADGGVPVSETDPMAHDLVGRVGDRPLRELWREVVERRREFEVDTGAPVAPMRA